MTFLVRKVTLLAFAAVFLTLLTAVYQRLTGPSHPRRIDVTLNGHAITFKLPRSHESTTPCPIILSTPELSTADMTSMKLFYQQYPPANLDEPWISTDFRVVQDRASWAGALPPQPPAGKLQYFIEMKVKDKTLRLGSTADPVVIRFRGEVPAFVLILHIAIMFLAMVASNLAGLEACFNNKTRRYFSVAVFAVILLFIGGLILGPIVQKYAFGAYWTGYPFGKDLTDNKVLISFAIWFVAVIANIKRTRPRLIVLAAIGLLAIYLIPHSMLGSELDYKTGNVVTSEK